MQTLSRETDPHTEWFYNVVIEEKGQERFVTHNKWRKNNGPTELYKLL